MDSITTSFSAPRPRNAKTYALVSHESAVEAIWSLAARGWRGVLDDEDVWMVPDATLCVRTQGDVKRLAKYVDLAALGIRSMPIDLLVPNKSCYSRGRLARFHVWSDFFAPHSFVRVHDSVLVSTPYFAVLQLAMARRANRVSQEEAQNAAEENDRIRASLGLASKGLAVTEYMRWGNVARFVRAVQVLCDFAGTYRYVPEANKKGPADPDVTYQTTPIITLEKLAAYLGQMSASKGIMRARRVLAAAFDGAASPMETMLALMLTLPVDMGGFGLPRPQLNRQITPAPAQQDLSSKEEMYADLCWPDQRLAVEYHGWSSHAGAGKTKVGEDAARTNSLTALGWTVLHATYEQVRTYAGMSLLARQVAHVLGTDLAEATELELVWRSRLLSNLLPARDYGC